MSTNTTTPATNAYLASLFSLEGRTALVTGGTRGIGQKMALALAQAGADLVLIQRNASDEETASQARSFGRTVTVVECDLADPEQVGKVVDRITDRMMLVIDILVNCGGIQRRAPAEKFKDEDWSQVLQVNLNAVWTLSRDIGRHMLEMRAKGVGQATRPRPRGKIINVASLLSYQGGMTVPAYAAAKHGVLGLIKALSNEWSAKGINVNGISPGYIATEMNTALMEDAVRSRQIMERIPAGRWGEAGDFEGAVVFLASGAADYVCGESLVVDGGWMGR